MAAQAVGGLQVSMRVVLGLWGLMLLALTFGFVMQTSWAVAMWPWPDRPLTYVFLGAFVAAVALPCIRIALAGDFAALRPAALSLAVMHAGIAASLLWLLQVDGELELLLYLVISAVMVLLSLLIFFLCRDSTVRDRQAAPLFIQVLFFVLALLLIVVGSALVVQIHAIFPWPLQVHTALLLGWLFYGCAVYFIYALLYPSWSFSGGALLGLAAHDLVMLGPLVMQLTNPGKTSFSGLAAYSVFVIASLLIACYFLFIHRSTRFWGRRLPRSEAFEDNDL